MKCALLFLGSLVCFGQASTFTPVCPASAVAGQSANYAVTLSGQAQAGSQFNINLPATATNVSLTAGAATIAASKQIDTANGIVLITGMNANLIQPGQVLNVSFSLPAAGQYTFGVSSPVGADANGSLISSSANPTCAVSVSPSINKCDLDGDGSVTQSDVSLIKSWVLGTAPMGQCDKTADTKCNVQDVVVIIKAATTTGVCSAI